LVETCLVKKIRNGFLFFFGLGAFYLFSSALEAPGINLVFFISPEATDLYLLE
jgi:hypothetical protein